MVSLTWSMMTDHRRYTLITLATMTFIIFLCRFLLFNFRESPKFLLAKGHDVHALDVIHSVAKFNGRQPPNLTIEDLKAIEFEEESRTTRSSTSSSAPLIDGPSKNRGLKGVVMSTYQAMFGHLRGLFRNPVYAYLFAVLAVAWVIQMQKSGSALMIGTCRTFGLSMSPVISYPLSSEPKALTRVNNLLLKLIDLISGSTSQVSLLLSLRRR